MAKGIVGLDIGTGAVRAAELRPGEPPVMTRFAQLTLPPGAMSNGEISDPDAVAAVLKELWRRGEFRSRRVAIAIASQGVVVRQVEVPQMDPADLRSALAYQVQDYIPMPVEETYLDSVILDRFVQDGGEMMRVLAVAAQRTVVDSFVAVLQQADLDPEVVDVAPLAIVRALSDQLATTEPEAEAIVDIGAAVTTIVVHERGLPRFVRILSAGGNDITAALIAELNMTPEDAEAEKIATGLRPEGAEVPPGAATVIENRARAFIDDVRRSVEYYGSLPEAGRLARILLTGGGAQLAFLPERLAATTRIPVEMGNALVRVQVGELGLSVQQVEQIALVAAVAVGAALED